MKQTNCFVYSSKLSSSKRKSIEQNSIIKKNNQLHITYLDGDNIEKFEKDLNLLVGKSSFFYIFKKKLIGSFISLLSVIVILFALISVSIYEDLFKKVLFTIPFSWELNDTIALVFVLVFFFGLLFMPSILDGERSEFKNLLSSWFNKEIRLIKKITMLFSNFDKKTEIHLYNFDLEDTNHWVWKLFINIILDRFLTINFYVRTDKVQMLVKKLKKSEILNIEVVKEQKIPKKFDVEYLLSSKEQKLYSLMQLCSTELLKQRDKKTFISLELFEYCGKNFIKEEKDSKNQLIFGFQNFINRSFDDFKFLEQKRALQIYFTSNVVFKDLSDEQKRLGYYLRNHIEECVNIFENPISLLILYFYVKDLVLDKRRTIKILEKFIDSIDKKQQYELIDLYWFDIANKMFDIEDIENFETSNNSYYRQLSINSLNTLIVLFKRNGHFEEAQKVAKYLYEINPNKYSVIICSLYERMGRFDDALNSLPTDLVIKKSTKPTDSEVKYYQRKAWIIVSQRKEELKQEGIDSLNKLEELIFSHGVDNEPLWLWHFYNIKANYDEWNENYDESIENYKKCLLIPMLGAYEYGATLINLSIAYRFKYIVSNFENISNINKSIKIAKLGYKLKKSIGDRDEMPVVNHNLSLNILYKILNTKIDNSLCNEVITLCQEALEILEKTKSVKRLGMILIELYICTSLLNLDFKEITNRLQTHITNLDDNELKQLLNIYKEFKKANKITSLEFIEKLI